jgi:hypothetical protein
MKKGIRFLLMLPAERRELAIPSARSVPENIPGSALGFSQGESNFRSVIQVSHLDGCMFYGVPVTI